MRLVDIRVASIYTIHRWKDSLHFFRLTVPSPFEVSTGNLFAVDDIPVSNEVLIQAVKLFLYQDIISYWTMCSVTYLLHLIDRELKVKDLGVGNDSLLRYRLGDDNEALSNASATYTME